MKRLNIRFPWLLGVFAILAAINLQADTIYLKSGRVIKADKAWEEDGRIKYQMGDAVISMPKSAVERIESDNPPPAAAPAGTPSTTPPAQEATGPRGARKIYFVPLAQFPESDLEPLVAYCQDRFHIKVNVLHAVPIPTAALDRDRRQLIAEELIAAMQRALPDLAPDPDAVLIGFTSADMYSQSQSLQFVFGWRSDSAVVSTARLNLHYPGEPAKGARPEVRLRKIVVKDIGMLYYGLPQSDNPASVLYSAITGIEELDKLTESF
jgi:predicted Zn-dependent protease